MAKTKPLNATAKSSDRAGDLIASAMRTLEAEVGGLTALSAAIRDGLGKAGQGGEPSLPHCVGIEQLTMMQVCLPIEHET